MCNKESCIWNARVFTEYTVVRRGWAHCICLVVVILICAGIYFLLKEIGIEL